LNLNKFWNETVIPNVSDNQHIIFLFRLQWIDNQFVTIGNLQRLNNNEKDYIFNYILDEVKDKSDYYKETAIKSIVFTYAIRDGKAIEKVLSTNIQYHNYHHHNLPITMDPLEYGDLLFQQDNSYAVQINDTDVAIIIVEDNLNKVKIYKKGRLRYEYTDKKLDSNTFSRLLNKKEWIFRNNKQILYQLRKSSKFIQPLISVDTLKNKFLTLDIETFIKDGKMISYIISIYDGNKVFSYYLTDFENHEIMLITAIKGIMIKEYDNYQVYIHNMSRFDAIFLLKILVNLGECKPIIHNDEIISITFMLNGYVVTFKDSLKILIKSLRDLGHSFNVDIQKSIFPYNFVNENNLDYIGPIPDFKYFDGISSLDYNCYIENYNIWNLKEESIRYCEIDCVSLYQIIVKFNELIFEKFKINIHKYPTLSSLAFAIYRTLFMINNSIPQLSGQIANDIRQGYTGGAVDMYIPIPPEGVKLYGYDVNSLYPYTMKEFDMPVGNPVLFKGDIRDGDLNAFGFFYYKIETPNNLEHPIIQTHVKTDSGIRTIAPLGSWYDILFSKEIDNAIKYGYKFEVLWGYKFERKNIFKDYVDTLYQLRLKYPKTDPLNYIAKLLMNSLYGRFGMIDLFPDITIFDNNKSYLNFINQHSDDIIDEIELGEKVLIKHRSDLKDQQNMLYGNLETHNTNIAIASAITAYARIHMSQFKNNDNFNLYYSDTDSIYTDKALPEFLVNNKILGMMKLEHIINKAIFLAPKVYYLETENGKVIYKVKGLSHDI
jgi:DNA polymerase type B, organellar and viral